MNIEYINDFDSFIEQIQKLFEYGPNKLIIGISPDINIWTNETFLPLAENQNFKKAVIQYFGGTIINFPGDINILLNTYGDSNFGLESLNIINTYLQSNNLPSSILGNDLIIDKYKVASYTKRAHLNGWYQNIIHYSFNTDVELVQSICSKPAIKIPGRLLDFNITPDMILKQLQILFDQL